MPLREATGCLPRRGHSICAVSSRWVDWQRDLLGLLAGIVLAAVTTPVGVSGAVFLLPFQLSVLHVPSPRITPTNLLYNVISGPGGIPTTRQP